MPPADSMGAPAPDRSGAGLACRDMIATLESGRRVIEQKFLGAGDVLEEAIGGIAALVSGLDRLTAAIGPAAIAETSRELADAAARLNALPAAQSVRRGVIDELVAQQEGFAAGMVEVRRNLAYMRAYSFNVKITSAGIADAESGFDVFAQEIAERIEAGHREVDEVERALAGFSREIEAVRGRADALERGCATMIPAVPDRLLASAATMAAHRGRIAAAVAQAGDLAREVRQKVSRMLAALQVGDSTRQRIEHVQHGIAMLEAGEPGLSEAAGARVRAVMAALLAALLEGAAADFDYEVRQIGLGLSGLAEDAAALLRLREVAVGQGGEDSGGVLRALEQRVGEATALVGEIEQAAGAAQATGARAAEAVRALSDRLGAILLIKSDVLYMALNTSLKSSRLGDSGKPLGIIAKELRAHAEELDVAVTGCAAALRALTATAAALAGEGALGAEGDESAGVALAGAIGRIREAGDETERDVAALAVHGEAVEGLLQRSIRELGLRDEIGGALHQVLRELGAAGADAATADGETQAVLATMFGRLGAVYTMVQERNIQAAQAACWAVPVSAVEAPAAVLEEEDALF